VVGCGPSTFESNLSNKGVTEAMAERKTTKAFSTDNTLEQIRRQKAQEMTSSTSLNEIKSALLKQQVLLIFNHFKDIISLPRKR
jgi:hypothetical protein